MKWTKGKDGKWRGICERYGAVVTITRQPRRQWRYDLTAPGKSTWALAGSVVSARIRAERYIRHTIWESPPCCYE